jgi:hypothetical protein
MLSLSLESPCLPHIQGSPKEPLSPSGHALTCSANPLLHAPKYASQLPHQTEWDVPYGSIERLLKLSENLRLDDEVTPVEAWHYILHQPNFDSLDIVRLRTLLGKLLNEVNCHGLV